VTTVLVVDNYDSFVYNLVHYVAEAIGAPDPPAADPGDPRVVVRRNDAVDRAGLRELDPDGVVVSPGPGTPEDAGVSTDVFRTDYPALGVCLGHQALCAANGATVGHAPEVVHGKPSVVGHDGRGVFADLPEEILVGRYHSLAVGRADLPAVLVETAVTDDEAGVVMGVRHRERPHVGVQFHPESILTGREAGDRSLAVGKRMIRNFCERCTTT
jgi:anthranilate synthase component 2